VWEYTFISIFLTIGLIIWEFSKSAGLNVLKKQSISNIERSTVKPHNSEVSEEIKKIVIETEVIENNAVKQPLTEEIGEEASETILSEENPFKDVLETIDNKPEQTSVPLRDTEQIIINNESEFGYFVEGDLPDSLLEDDFWENDAIEIIPDAISSNEQMDDILSKIDAQIPLDAEEIGIFEYHSKPMNKLHQGEENIFAD
jgi:hypothetical protein